MSGFRLHPEAYDDIDELWEFIAQDKLDAADRVREEIYDAVQKLVAFPYQGRTRTDLTSRPLRFWRVRHYLIAYAPDEKPLWVMQSCMAVAAPVSWPRYCGAGKSKSYSFRFQAATPRGAGQSRACLLRTCDIGWHPVVLLAAAHCWVAKSDRISPSTTDHIGEKGLAISKCPTAGMVTSRA
jgi:plasmid stabilization system protein ParE